MNNNNEEYIYSKYIETMHKLILLKRGEPKDELQEQMMRYSKLLGKTSKNVIDDITYEGIKMYSYMLHKTE